MDDITSSLHYEIKYEDNRICYFNYPKEKFLDPIWDIKKNLKFFYNKNSSFFRLSLGSQVVEFLLSSFSRKFYEKQTEVCVYENKIDANSSLMETTLLKKFTIPQNTVCLEEIK